MNLAGAEVSGHNLSKKASIVRSQELNVRRLCLAEALEFKIQYRRSYFLQNVTS